MAKSVLEKLKGLQKGKPENKKRKGVRPTIVTVNDDALNMIDQLANELRKKGMQVNRIVSSGFITGLLETNKYSVLKKVKGVLNVEEETTVQYNPPTSDLQ